MKKSRKFMIAIGWMALLWSAGDALATCTSTNAVSANWNTAGNWTCTTGAVNHVPAANETVIVNTNMTVNAATASLTSLTINNGFTLTSTNRTVTTGVLNVDGALSMGNALTVTGATTITGSLDITGNNGSVLSGLVTVTSTGTWTNSGNRAVTFQGGIANAGTFDAGTGTQTFDTNAQTISGTSTMTFGGNVVVTGVTVTNTNTSAAGVSITGTLSGTGTWTNGDGTAAAVLTYNNATAPMNLGGTFTVNPAGNKVIYGRAGIQNIKTATYHHLELAGTSAKSATAGLTVNGDFTLSGSASFTASSFTHNFYGSWIVNTTAAAPLSTATTSLINFNTPATPAPTSVGGTSSATLAFSDVTINNTSGVTFNQNASFSAGTTPTLTVSAGATFTPAAAVVISGTGTLTGSGIAQVTHVGTSGGDFAAQYTIATQTLTNLTIEYAGAGAQFADALATYGSMKISNSSGVTLAGNATVNTALILNTGVLTTTASFTLTTAANCPTSVSRTSGWVAGFLSLKFPVAAPITCTYYVGDAANYRPIDVTFASVTTTGNMVGSVTQSAGEHAQIGSSLINSAKDVNYYWTLTNGAIVFTNYSATFNFNAADYDAAADPTKFTAQRYSAGWTSPTVDGAACTNCVTVTGITAGFGDFAVGETTFAVSTNPGWFNAFETSTAANAITGKIYTKIINASFDLDVVAVNAYRTGVKPNYTTNPITVELLNASDNSGAITNETGCRSTWVSMSPVQSFTFSPTWTSSRATVTIPAQTAAARDVRVKVTQGTRTGCSTDDFSIRPTSFTVTSTNATNTSTSGTPIIKTGANFNLTATAVAGYDGTPSIDNTKVVGTPTAGTIGGSFSAAPVGTGIASGSSFYYSEVGNFGLNANAVYDSSFTSVDTSGTDCTADFSNSLVGGKYGCSFGSAAVAQNTGVTGFGRFTPDNFDVSYNTPVLSVSCTSFTYVGQTFTYTTAPILTVTARNGTNNGLTNATTTNYAGSYAKFSNAAGTSLNQSPYDTQGGRYNRFDALGGGATPALGTTGLPAVTADPAISSFVAGVGTFTFDSGTGLQFTRSTTTPNAPFNADIALTLNVVDTDAVAFGSNPAHFGTASANNGISFTGAIKTMRFGRLQLSNSHGSELLTLRVPVQAQYWNGSTFVTNTDDNCTPLSASTVTMDDYKGSLAACNTGLSVISGANLSGGIGYLRLSAPGSGKIGSVRLRANLGTASGNTCLVAGGAQSAATSAAETHLQVKSGATYDGDPTVRASFGVRRAGPVIYMREMY